MKKLSDLDFGGKIVFLRADLDVPIRGPEDSVEVIETEQGTRLTNLKATVELLLSKKAKVLIAGHIDRPSYAPSTALRATDGKPPGYNPALSTKLLLEPLREILAREVEFSEQLTANLPASEAGNLHLTKETKSNVNGPADAPSTTLRALAGRQMSNVVLLENLRFWPGEVKNDQAFAQKLSRLAQVYVNEAFGNCHRAHASMVTLPQILPHAAGLHLEEEVGILSKLLKNPRRPFVAIVGGVKIETKIPLIENLAKVADHVLVGGEIAKQLTIDNLQLTTEKKADAPSTTLRALAGRQMSNVMEGTLTGDGKDIDEESINKFRSIIQRAKTIVWNGPLGLFEEGNDHGTMAVASAIIDSGAYSVVGGGETSQFLTGYNLISKFSFVSAGGGAMLEFLSGKELPGIKALE